MFAVSNPMRIPRRRYFRWWMWRLTSALALSVIIVSAPGASYQYVAQRRDLAAAPPPGRLIDIGGRRLHLWCEGQGTPVVMFDSSAGGTALDWYRAPCKVSRVSRQRVPATGRAWATAMPGPFPRTAEQIAAEFAELLHRSDLTLPVVVVGWSLSGWYVRSYATKHATDVAGLVVVDASHEDQAARFEAAGIYGGTSFVAPYLSMAANLGVLRLIPNPYVTRPEEMPEPGGRTFRATSR